MAVARTRTDKAPKGTTKPRGIEVPIEADPGAGGARRELLASEVLDKAAALFAKQGFAATSLKDVADAVGLHRSSIYYYYPNKDALLQELIQGVTLPVAQIFQEVDGEDLTPLTKIGEVVRRLVLWVSDPHTHFRLVERSEAELPDAVAGAHKEAKRHILREMMRLIEEAELAGEARATDRRVSALSIIGMTMWTAWWLYPSREQRPEEIAVQMAENAMTVVRRTTAAKKTATVGALSQEIRENLALIERLAQKD
ncbi:MAG: TetR/AcrR family transcriptional regulator [Rhizobiales bacterium]|nr:TetR/AcrR family transcriptional regulator [Hyphomicrobiales bacterium]